MVWLAFMLTPQTPTITMPCNDAYTTHAPMPCTARLAHHHPRTTHAPMPCTARLARHHIPNPTPPNTYRTGLHDTAAILYSLIKLTRILIKNRLYMDRWMVGNKAGLMNCLAHSKNCTKCSKIAHCGEGLQRLCDNWMQIP